MKKKLSALIVLAIFSLLLFTLPALADSKPASANNMSGMNMSDTPASEAAPGDSSSSAVTVAKADQLQVSVQTDPEKPAPNQPVNIMIIVKNKATGQPVLDAAVNIEMMHMDSSSHGNMSGMSANTENTLKGQAKPDSMEPGMYAITLTPTKQGEWNQDIHISSPTLGETTVTVPLKVSKSGPNWLLIGGVGGAVVLAGIFAQILKRKQSASKEV